MASRFRGIVIAAAALVSASPLAAAPSGRYPAGAEEKGPQGRANVVYALEHIRTATGQTAMARMQACAMKIQWGESWSARQAADIPQYGTKAGDITLQVIFDASAGKGLTARWLIRNGVAAPGSGWAKLIQTAPKPMPVEHLTC